jgi:hypothetical protein
VNDLGQVAGRYNWNAWGPPCQAFFWDQGALILCSNTGDNHVTDMNNLGQIVGNLGVGDHQGFVWDHDSYFLFDLQQYLTEVQYDGRTYTTDNMVAHLDGINDSGQLSGTFGMPSQDLYFWLIATPVPEPSIATLFFFGSFTLIYARRILKKTERGRF